MFAAILLRLLLFIAIRWTFFCWRFTNSSLKRTSAHSAAVPRLMCVQLRAGVLLAVFQGCLLWQCVCLTTTKYAASTWRSLWSPWRFGYGGPPHSGRKTDTWRSLWISSSSAVCTPSSTGGDSCRPKRASECGPVRDSSPAHSDTRALQKGRWQGLCTLSPCGNGSWWRTSVPFLRLSSRSGPFSCCARRVGTVARPLGDGASPATCTDDRLDGSGRSARCATGQQRQHAYTAYGTSTAQWSRSDAISLHFLDPSLLWLGVVFWL